MNQQPTPPNNLSDTDLQQLLQRLAPKPDLTPTKLSILEAHILSFIDETPKSLDLPEIQVPLWAQGHQPWLPPSMVMLALLVLITGYVMGHDVDVQSSSPADPLISYSFASDASWHSFLNPSRGDNDEVAD